MSATDPARLRRRALQTSQILIAGKRLLDRPPDIATDDLLHDLGRRRRSGAFDERGLLPSSWLSTRSGSGVPEYQTEGEICWVRCQSPSAR